MTTKRIVRPGAVSGLWRQPELFFAPPYFDLSAA
jgi:hypothetical protein